MSAFKHLEPSDVSIMPYFANKTWIISGSNFTNYGINIYSGSNTTLITSSSLTSSSLLLNSSSIINLGTNLTLPLNQAFKNYNSYTYNLYLEAEIFEDFYIRNDSQYGETLVFIPQGTGVITSSYELASNNTNGFNNAINFESLGYAAYLTKIRITASGSSQAVQYNTYYKLIEQLYYSNYIYRPKITGSYYTSATSSFNNFDQSTAASGSTNYVIKYYPTGSQLISLLSIPQNLFGSKILPNSLNITSSNLNITDDGEGNLLNSGQYIGNIVYSHGILAFTSGSAVNHITGSNYILSFKNEHIIYESSIRCNVREGEFNLSLNPTLTTDNSGSLREFATGSYNPLLVTGSGYFNPYVTTVGLYNDAHELLAIGKMSQPVPIPETSDITFLLTYSN